MSDLTQLERQCTTITAAAMNAAMNANKNIVIDPDQDWTHTQVLYSGKMKLQGLGDACPIVGCADPTEQILTILVELPLLTEPNLDFYQAVARVNDAVTAGCLEYNEERRQLYLRASSFFRGEPLRAGGEIQ